VHRFTSVRSETSLKNLLATKNTKESVLSSHLPVLDFLRGVAALSVCLFHFSCGNPGFLPPQDALHCAGSFGWLGVQSFFVISGVVIPYSLHQRNYQLKHWKQFLTRRLKRIEPPYLACIGLVIGLNYLSLCVPGFQGTPFKFSALELFSHLAYLNVFIGFPWYSPVFWTLAKESQFYLFIALVFPLLNHQNYRLRLITVLVTALLGLIGFGATGTGLLFHWLPLFSIGIVAYLFVVGNLTTRTSFLLGSIVTVLNF